MHRDGEVNNVGSPREDATVYNPLKNMEAAPGFEPGNNGFAEREEEKE